MHKERTDAATELRMYRTQVTQRRHLSLQDPRQAYQMYVFHLLMLSEKGIYSHELSVWGSKDSWELCTFQLHFVTKLYTR